MDLESFFQMCIASMQHTYKAVVQLQQQLLTIESMLHKLKQVHTTSAVTSLHNQNNNNHSLPSTSLKGSSTSQNLPSRVKTTSTSTSTSSSVSSTPISKSNVGQLSHSLCSECQSSKPNLPSHFTSTFSSLVTLNDPPAQGILPLPLSLNNSNTPLSPHLATSFHLSSEKMDPLTRSQHPSTTSFLPKHLLSKSTPSSNFKSSLPHSHSPPLRPFTTTTTTPPSSIDPTPSHDVKDGLLPSSSSSSSSSPCSKSGALQRSNSYHLAHHRTRSSISTLFDGHMFELLRNTALSPDLDALSSPKRQWILEQQKLFEDH
ncbi:hypothetical protein HMI56_004762, partial [Coelomomyces lativittatus]